VIFATDGSGPSDAAEATLAWPCFDRAEIRVLSVADVYEPWRTGIAPTMYQEALDAYQRDLDDAQANHKRLADATAARLQKSGRNATADVRVGDAAAEILDAVDAWQADMVVMGSRGQTGLKRFFLGSVARNVVHGAHVNVLVAHARGEIEEQQAAA
jgi:nucleotide-binding universal stress UspA family protein